MIPIVIDFIILQTIAFTSYFSNVGTDDYQKFNFA